MRSPFFSLTTVEVPMRRHPLFLLLISLVPALPAVAQTSDLDLIPASTAAAVFMKPNEAFRQPALELVPREILTALGKQELGFDPVQITTATLLVDTPETLEQPPGFALIMRFDEPQTLSEKLTSRLEKGELDGKPVWRGSSESEPVVYMPNDRTIFVGIEAFIGKMTNTRGAESELLSLIRASGDSTSHFRGYVSIASMRGLIRENLPPANRVPPPMRDFLELPDLIESLSVEVNFSEAAFAELKIQANDEKGAERIVEIVKMGLVTGKNMMLAQIADGMQNESAALQEAVQQYGERVGTWIESSFQPKIVGSELVFRGEDQTGFAAVAGVGAATGLLLPAVQGAREAARRMDAANQLRQIVIAAHNFHDANKRFPGNIVSEDGTPLLSWRVAILPYLDEGALYDQFHLDEPWDSEHNIQLLNQMPDALRNRNVDFQDKTVFLGFAGPGTIFEGDEVSFGIIQDGTSRTIFCVEADADSAVEWSRPADLPYDPDRPVSGVGNLRPGGFNAAFCDGHVRLIPNSTDPETLHWSIQRNDGNLPMFDED